MCTYNTWCNWCAYQIKMVKSNSWVKKNTSYRWWLSSQNVNIFDSISQSPNISHWTLPNIWGPRLESISCGFQVQGNFTWQPGWLNPIQSAIQTKTASSSVFFWACQRTDTRWSNASPNRCHSLLLSGEMAAGRSHGGLEPWIPRPVAEELGRSGANASCQEPWGSQKMLAFMLRRTEVHQWMYVFYFRFLEAFGHCSFTKGLPTRAGLERVGKKPPHLPIVLSPETPPQNYRCFRKPLSTAAQQTSRTSQLCHWLSAAPCTRKSSNSNSGHITARSDDHKNYSTQTSLFFFRASGVQNKNASFPNKNFTKTKNPEFHQFHPSVTLNLNFQKINQILKE